MKGSYSTVWTCATGTALQAIDRNRLRNLKHTPFNSSTETNKNSPVQIKDWRFARGLGQAQLVSEEVAVAHVWLSSGPFQNPGRFETKPGYGKQKTGGVHPACRWRAKWLGQTQLVSEMVPLAHLWLYHIRRNPNGDMSLRHCLA